MSVFPTANSPLMHAWMARLCVLMEDLRIEVHCLLDDSISTEMQVEPNVRKIYFLRRAVATLREFAEGVRLLERDADFQALKARVNPDAEVRWSNAVKFFASREKFFVQVRNDVGGHFGTEAAKYAVDRLQPDADGKMECAETGPNAFAERLHFTSLIAATALTRHLTGASDLEKVDLLVKTVVDAVGHATRAVGAITVPYLWERFGRG